VQPPWVGAQLDIHVVAPPHMRAQLEVHVVIVHDVAPVHVRLHPFPAQSAAHVVVPLQFVSQ
jgi:hypothetical protein